MRHSYLAAVAAFTVIALALAQPAHSKEPLVTCKGSNGGSISWYPDQMELDVHRPDHPGQAPGLNLEKCAGGASAGGPIFIPQGTPPASDPNALNINYNKTSSVSGLQYSVEPTASGGRRFNIESLTGDMGTADPFASSYAGLKKGVFPNDEFSFRLPPNTAPSSVGMHREESGEDFAGFEMVVSTSPGNFTPIGPGCSAVTDVSKIRFKYSTDDPNNGPFGNPCIINPDTTYYLNVRVDPSMTALASGCGTTSLCLFRLYEAYGPMTQCQNGGTPPYCN